MKVGPANEQNCRIDADLYLPDGASATRKVPAILTTHGFGGDKADSNQTAVGKGFVRQGYAVLSYSGLGFGKTNCKITLDDPDWDGKAGRQMVDVLAGKRGYLTEGSSTPQFLRMISTEAAGDPRVGMIGGSYGGQIQYAVAKQDPRIDAIIPIITWNDLTYSLAPGNVAKKQWIDLFFGAGISSGAQNATADPETHALLPQLRRPGLHRRDRAEHRRATPTRPRRRSPSTPPSPATSSSVKAPTLLVQGQKDTLFNLNEAVATYRSLQAQKTPVKMVWQSWGHSGSNPVPGELDFGAESLRDSYLGNRFLNWMNHYVRGISSASTGPAVRVLPRLGEVRHQPGQRRHRHRRGVRQEQHGLVGPQPHALLHRRPRAHAVEGRRRGRRRRPTPTRRAAPTNVHRDLGARGQPGQQRAAGRPRDVGRRSPPSRWPRPADVVGSPKVTLHLSTPAAGYTQMGGPSGQLVLFAKIFDIAPDGSRVLKNRMVAPMRVVDTNKPVTLRLPGIVHRFQTGHRIQIAVAASDAAYAGNTLPHEVADHDQPDRAEHARHPRRGPAGVLGERLLGEVLAAPSR